MQFVILAGGVGSRFAREGCECPKPMMPICGRPMIGLLIEVLMRCGAESIRIGANACMPALLDYLEGLLRAGAPLDIKKVETSNSFMTLRDASEGLKGRFIAVTCDAIFPAEEFCRYVDRVASSPDGAAVMGLTRYVDDESPLYARISEDGEVVDYRYGGPSFDGTPIISAGVYGLSDEIMERIAKGDRAPESLNDFQRILAADTPMRVIPYEFSIAFDVDDIHDLRKAEEFLKHRM